MKAVIYVTGAAGEHPTGRAGEIVAWDDFGVLYICQKTTWFVNWTHIAAIKLYGDPKDWKKYYGKDRNGTGDLY